MEVKPVAASGLVQAILPFSAIHHSSSTFVDDDDLVLDDHIVLVAFERMLGCQGLLDL